MRASARSLRRKGFFKFTVIRTQLDECKSKVEQETTREVMLVCVINSKIPLTKRYCSIFCYQPNTSKEAPNITNPTITTIEALNI